MSKHAKMICTCFAMLLWGGSAHADSVSEFYSGPGKFVRFIVRSEAGSGYDTFTRLVARHIGRHIPGSPTIVVVNMPGAGGIVAANYLANIAPKDGTILSIVGQGLVAAQALGLSQQFKADLRTFNWIANLTSSNQMLAVWHTSQTRTLEDAKSRVTLIGASGAGEGSASVQYPAFYNNVLGTQFKIVAGYTSGSAINLAMERGEIEGRGTNSYADYKAATPRYLDEKLIRPIIQIGLRRDPAMPDVPLLLEQPVTGDKKAMIEFMSRASTAGRPLATTPDVPTERVAALRQAFAKMVEDPEFIADAKKINAEISPSSGEETQKLIQDLMSTPADIRAKVAEAIKPRAGDVSK